MTTCPLCSASLAFAPVVNTMARHGIAQRSVRCMCGLVQADPKPSADELRVYYESGEYRRLYPAEPRCDLVRGSPHSTASGPSPGYQATLDPEFVAKRVKRLVATHGLTPESDVLEHGCGPGMTLAMLRAVTGCYVEGHDVDPAMMKQAASRGVSVSRLATAGFDLVLALHVVEHALDPVAYVRHLATFGHRVHVEVPNLEHADGADWWQWPHIYNFDAATLRATMERAGLRNVVVGEIGRFLEAWGDV